MDISVNSVIDDALRCSEATLDPKRFSIEVCGEQELQVWTDRSLLLQILINLIGNAGHAAIDGKADRPNIRIHTSREESFAIVRVIDNGCGMSKETIERVFDARFTTRPTGNGLGLHFCAIAVKRLHGSIQASSAGVGCGATFTLKLPLDSKDNPSSTRFKEDQGEDRTERVTGETSDPVEIGGIC
ncbi:MAG: ATP-binding protein [Planctomycetota bacterium]